MIFSMRLPMAMDSVSEMPGKRLEVTIMEPSSSFGMNSVPMNLSEMSEATTSTAAPISTGLRCRKAMLRERL